MTDTLHERVTVPAAADRRGEVSAPTDGMALPGTGRPFEDATPAFDAGGGAVPATVPDRIPAAFAGSCFHVCVRAARLAPLPCR